MEEKIYASEKLLEWDRNDDPLAPLTSLQEKSIAGVLQSNCRPFPNDLPVDDDVVIQPQLYVTSSSESDTRSSLSESQLKGVRVENAQQFLSWISDVEEKIIEDDDILYKAYVDELKTYQSHCCDLLNDATAALDQLESLQKKYTFVSNKTNALHEACEHLLAEQTTLVNSAETISEKLRYFNELESISQKIASPTLSVLNESFVPLLSRLDECIAYLEANLHFKEASVYLARFKHQQNLALGMIRSYVMNTLQQATQQVLPRRENLSPSENAFTLYYGKFRSHAPRIHALMKQIEERVENNPEYQLLLSDCHQCYFSQRSILLGPSVSAAINDLAINHQRDHCSLVRSGCAFLLHVCEDEFQLFKQFFSQHTTQLEQFLEGLCMRLYDVLRPIIIHINHLETLAELCGILKVEMLEEHIQFGAHELQAFQNVVHQMLEDVQERLVYRTHIYIKTDILNYNPASGDLAYPEKLEMMESIAESLSCAALSRSSSQSSLVSSSSLGSSVFANCVNDMRTLRNQDGPAVISVSSSEQITEGEKQPEVSPDVESQGIRQTRPMTYSPADLHGMWYPTVRRTLVCLSKLYRCLDKTIFQGLSQEVLTMCIQSLVSASSVISKNKTLLDGQLFQIKHLLILREQIAPFQIDFAIKETTLDFSKVKVAAYGLLQKRSRLLSLNSSNAILEFLLQGTPHVTEQLIDSKKAVDKQLKLICEEFIAHTSEMLIGPLQAFLDKAKVVLQLQAEESGKNVCLSKQPFALADVLSQLVTDSVRHLKSTLPSLHRSMSLYLANPDTEYILFRPVKARVQGSFEQFLQLVRVNYTEEEQMIVACPSIEQVSIILSSGSGKS